MDNPPGSPGAPADGKRKASKTRLEQGMAVAVLVLLVIGSFVVIQPFLTALCWAAVLCFCLWPMQRRLVIWLHGRRTLAALITTLTVTLILVAPFVIIGFSIADDARALAESTQRWIAGGPPPPPKWFNRVPIVGARAKTYWQEFVGEAFDFAQKLRRAASEETPPETPPPAPQLEPGQPKPDAIDVGEDKVANTLKAVFARTRSWFVVAGVAIGKGVVEVALSVLLAFFIFRDGGKAADRLRTGINRIAGDRGKHLLEVAGNTVRGVVYGILGTALVQAIMAGVGFVIAGVPGAALLALLTFFLSVVPMGPPLIWIPAVLWLFSQGFTGRAIFMLIWGLIVSSVDNVVKPWLISQGSELPFVLIFFGVIGGALAFGFIGVFLGPTLLAVLYRLIEEWSRVPGPLVAPAESSSPGAQSSM
ncbi:MAG TPA: AI-2E family transporter [Verrucomicrobiae bacterium]|nr:AI-2E family transporter [Verrucomicrobiae bacterium]